MILTASKFYGPVVGEVTPAQEDAFFSSLKLGNRTFKRTHAGRFAELDRAVLGRLVAEGANLDRVLDVGVSSGVTTLELLEALRARGFEPKITATDLALDARIVEILPGCRVLVDNAGHPLQHDLFGAAVRPWPRRLDYATGMWALRPLINRAVSGRLPTALRAGQRQRRVKLVSRRLEREPAVEVLRDDLLSRRESFAGKFGFARAANVANADVLSPDELRRAAANLASYLDPERAWLLVTRTDNAKAHHGTLFGYDERRGFRPLERYGKGAEAEGVFLRAKP